MRGALLVGLALLASLPARSTFAVDADGSVLVNGRIAWDVRVAARLAWPMAPVTDGERVFVGTPEQRVRAMDLDGGTLWEVEVAGPVAAPPTADGGRVYVLDGSGHLTAMDPATGGVLWARPVAKGRTTGAPVAVDGRLVTAGLDRQVRALRGVDGAEVWAVTVPAAPQGAPVVCGGWVVLACADGVVRALRIEDGSAGWESVLGSSTVATPRVVEDVVVVGTKDGVLHALSGATGEALWSYRAGGALDSSPGSDGTLVFVGSTDGTLHAVDLHLGTAAWTYAAGAPIRGTPAVSGGQIAVGTTAGILHVVDARTGRPAWRVGVGGSLDGAPALVQGRAIVGSTDGRVVAIGDAADVSGPSALPVEPPPELGRGMWVGRRTFLGRVEEVLVCADGTVLVLSDPTGLVRTQDLGLHWERARGFGAARPRHIEERGRDELLARTDDGVFQSRDRGRTWTREPDRQPPPSRRARWGGSRGLREIAFGDGAWRSVDGGRSWSEVVTPFALRFIALLLGAEDGLLATDAGGGVHRSVDGGRSWTETARLARALVQVAECPTDRDRYLALDESGTLLVSTDGGVSWEAVAGTGGGREARQVVWVPGSSAAAYALLAPARVLVTADGGGTWSETTYGLADGIDVVGARLAVGPDGQVVVTAWGEDGGGGVYRLGKIEEHRRLESVSFESGSANLRPEALAVLDRVFDRMHADAGLRLRAEGHTDDVGDDARNAALSVARAKAVAAAAARRGIASDRILPLGFGESRPLGPNDAEAGRAANRRVEIYLVDLPGP